MRAAVLTILVSYELLAQAPQPDPLMLEHNRALQLADQGHESEALEIILGVIKRAPLFQPGFLRASGSGSSAGPVDVGAQPRTPTGRSRARKRGARDYPGRHQTRPAVPACIQK